MHEVFANPFFHALDTEHAHLALGAAPAVRYPADVIPFAALSEQTPEALLALAELVRPDESVYVVGDDIPSIARDQDRFEYVKALPCWQYHFTESLPEAEAGLIHKSEIRVLDEDDTAAMVALTDVAFPGYFRPRQLLLGPFYGIYSDSELVAMSGTRVCVPGYREISAVCTHPAHTGRGYAAALTRHVLRANAEAGTRSFLHVLQANHRAIALYERLGFTRTHAIPLHQLRRL